jgi:hypothetical protein
MSSPLQSGFADNQRERGMPKHVIQYKREWPKHVLDAFRSRSVRRAGLCVVGLLRGQGGLALPRPVVHKVVRSRSNFPVAAPQPNHKSDDDKVGAVAVESEIVFEKRSAKQGFPMLIWHEFLQSQRCRTSNPRSIAPPALLTIPTCTGVPLYGLLHPTLGCRAPRPIHCHHQ